MSVDSFKTFWDKIITVRKAEGRSQSTVVTIEWDSADKKKIETIDLRLKPTEVKRLIRALVESI